MVPCPVFPPPPMGWGGVWCPCGGVYTYIHTYIPTYVHTYIHTITLPYLTLPYLTLHYLTLHSIHTYIHTITLHYLTLHYLTLPYITLPYIPYVHTYIHTNIPTYQHTNIPPPQATGGGTRRTIPPPQATGGGDQKNHTTTTGHRGGDQKNQTILSTHTHWWGGEGGWPTLHHIYTYLYIIIHNMFHIHIQEWVKTHPTPSLHIQIAGLASSMAALGRSVKSRHRHGQGVLTWIFWRMNQPPKKTTELAFGHVHQ